MTSPHGPCIINSATILYLNGSSLGFGISAEISLSICDGSRIFYSGCNQNKKWQCGNPLFWNSTTYKSAIIIPNIVPDLIVANIWSNFILKTLDIISGLSSGFCPGIIERALVILGHFELQVNVTKKSGFP